MEGLDRRKVSGDGVHKLRGQHIPGQYDPALPLSSSQPLDLPAAF